MNNDSNFVPPFRIETPQGDVLGSGYNSRGHCQATASKWAIDASVNGSKDLDGVTLVDRLLVKDSQGTLVREVTKNYPAH